jgi:putative addiction module component (TIGR02574 family)
MSAITEKVFIEALSLPTRQRAALVHKLLQSLEAEEGSPEIEAAWQTEAEERARAFDEGKLAERSAEDVLRDAYRKLE